MFIVKQDRDGAFNTHVHVRKVHMCRMELFLVSGSDSQLVYTVLSVGGCI